jgi:hypothetical protein
VGLSHFFKILRSFFPDYGPLMKMGFKAKTLNNDFVFEKDCERYRLRFYTGINPDGATLAPILREIEIPDGCVVVYFRSRLSSDEQALGTMAKRFEHFVDRGDWVFFFDTRLEIESSSLELRLEELETALNKANF